MVVAAVGGFVITRLQETETPASDTSVERSPAKVRTGALASEIETPVVDSSAPAAVTAAATPPAGSDPSASEDPAPPHGPGAATPFDPATAPRVPEGTTRDEYVSAYFEALRARDYAVASTMIPRVGSLGSTEEFEASLRGYEVAGFALVESAEASIVGQPVVLFSTLDNGLWNVAWEFADTEYGTVVKDLFYSRSGAGACH